jgi:hypothetical protein
MVIAGRPVVTLALIMVSDGSSALLSTCQGNDVALTGARGPGSCVLLGLLLLVGRLASGTMLLRAGLGRPLLPPVLLGGRSSTAGAAVLGMVPSRPALLWLAD